MSGGEVRNAADDDDEVVLDDDDDDYFDTKRVQTRQIDSVTLDVTLDVTRDDSVTQIPTALNLSSVYDGRTEFGEDRLIREQGCQMVYFQTKNPNLGKFCM
jgi:hypothetical protein